MLPHHYTQSDSNRQIIIIIIINTIGSNQGVCFVQQQNGTVLLLYSVTGFVGSLGNSDDC